MPKRSSFTTVTPFSKLLAMTLFVVFPLITFYLGDLYGRATLSTSSLQPVETFSTKPQSCTEEAKQCPDGSYVFRELPNCSFSACPVQTNPSQPPIPSKTLQQFQTKQDQILFQLSQKTSIAPDALLISYVNDQNDEKTYAGGSFTTQKNGTLQYFFATVVNGKWVVTAISRNTPNCSEINPYYYPKTLVPACKDSKNNIIAR